MDRESAVRIEPLTPARLYQAQVFVQAAFPHDVTAIGDVATGLSRKSSGERERYWVALHGATIVGLIGLWWTADPRVAWVSWFAVKPAWQGRGVGRMLWAELERELANRPGTTLRVWTTSEYPVAFAWYQRMGFRVLLDEDEIRVLSRCPFETEPPLDRDHIV